MASLVFVIVLTGSASILRRQPDMSSIICFHWRNISWKMSFPAQPDWIVQVIAAAGEAIPPPAPPVAGDAAPPPAEAWDERHAGINAPSAERPAYFRNPP